MAWDAETSHATDYLWMDGVSSATHADQSDNGESSAEYTVKVLRDDVRKGDYRGQRLAAELGSTRFFYWKAGSGASDPKHNDILTVSSVDWLIRDVQAVRLGTMWALECTKAAVDG